MGSPVVSSLGLPMIAAAEEFLFCNALNRLSSSGGRLSGCESLSSAEDRLREEPKVLLLRGLLLGFFSLSRCSFTAKALDFFSGEDECADLVRWVVSGSTDGRLDE